MAIRYILLIVIVVICGIYLFRRWQLFMLFGVFGGNESVLNVFLDERNFYFGTHTGREYNETGTPTFTLSDLKKYLAQIYPKKLIKMHIVTKNSNMTDYIDELEVYKDRYDPDTDVLYIANTLYDTEKISKTSGTHHLRGRDDFLMLILALEHLDNGEEVLIMSKDKFKDVGSMYKMPAFNMIRIDGDNIEKRHINPSKYHCIDARFKKMINDPKLKVAIPDTLEM